MNEIEKLILEQQQLISLSGTNIPLVDLAPDLVIPEYKGTRLSPKDFGVANFEALVR